MNMFDVTIFTPTVRAKAHIFDMFRISFNTWLQASEWKMNRQSQIRKRNLEILLAKMLRRINREPR